MEDYFGVYLEVKNLPGIHANAGAPANDPQRFLSSIREFLALAFGERPSYIMAIEKNTLLAMVSMSGGKAASITIIM